MTLAAPAPTGLHRALGLSDEEFDRIVELIGRSPTETELAMFSVMWSEHCSYKSSRPYLKSLPTTGPRILVGPGEGAGIVEVAPGLAIAWKIESHNHPSFVEPFNGAATGVGGIVRDILSMGARPIALMDSLRFGPLDDARTRYLVDGVVHGISSYGNSIGVPTVGGELIFEDCYAENPLVNVACLGVIDTKLMHGRAEGVGNPVVLFGSSTGRDGIGGASVLASASFDESSDEKRPSVQVGDPFTEKLLIEASLEMIAAGLVVGFQDLGAGGISCPTSEMSFKGSTGMAIDADRVHLRERDMEPFEVMISESQERMMAVVEPRNVDAVLAICARWGLEARIIGRVTETGKLEVHWRDEVVADVPAAALAEGPVYDRPTKRPAWNVELQNAPCGDDPPPDIERAWLDVLGAPGVASPRWAWEQYDHMIFLGTVRGPGGDGSVIRLPGSDVAVALSVDGPGRYCYLDPYEGARLAVAEAARNVAVTGAEPLAVTNCLNFGSPERSDVMWQFAEVVRGIADACLALGTPVTGGNVSFYNETSGRPIWPTPVIGMVGVLEHAERALQTSFTHEGEDILLLGETDIGAFGGSEYAKIVHGVVAGRPPMLDLDAERALHGFLRAGCEEGVLSAAHDLSSGGLAVALAEMSVARRIGASIELPPGEPHRVLFAESPSRALVTCPQEVSPRVQAMAADKGLPCRLLGSTEGNSITVGEVSISVGAVVDAYEGGLPASLGYDRSSDHRG